MMFTCNLSSHPSGQGTRKSSRESNSEKIQRERETGIKRVGKSIEG